MITWSWTHLSIAPCRDSAALNQHFCVPTVCKADPEGRLEGRGHVTAEQKTWKAPWREKTSETQGVEDLTQQDSISPWGISLWLDPRIRAQEQHDFIVFFFLK